MNYHRKENNKDVILIVDDKPGNLKVAAGVLGGDYTLSIANNGANALKLLENGRPDLILLDVMMPEMDGYEVCKKIKENEKTREIPIIFLTAKTEIEDIIKGFEFGAVDYITKPFHPTEMKVRVKNQLSLYHAQNEVKQINREKDKFLSIMAHDLKSPISTIVGLSRLLKIEIEEKNFDVMREYTEYIHQASQKSIDLLNDLMAWVSSQTGRLEHKPEPLFLAELVHENLKLYTEAASQKSITLNTNIPSDIQVVADRAMLGTVLRNLIGNAIKFTFTNGTITLNSRIEKNETIISISDNGMGMKPEMVNNLFNLDKPTGRPGTNGEPSTGLGLTLCKEFVEKNGGEIWAESEEHKGSHFHFSVPMG